MPMIDLLRSSAIKFALNNSPTVAPAGAKLSRKTRNAKAGGRAPQSTLPHILLPFLALWSLELGLRKTDFLRARFDEL